MCTQRVTQEPPHEKHGKGELAGLQPPRTGLPSPRHGSASPMGLKVCPHPVYTCSASKPPRARLLRAGEEGCHLPVPLPLAEPSGDWGTRGHGWQHLVPLTARAGARSRDTVPAHIHQDPAGHGPGGIPVTLPHGQGTGEAARQGTAAPQAKARMFPNPGQKQQAEGLLIASRGALVCLSILQQTRFAALIPIWK